MNYIFLRKLILKVIICISIVILLKMENIQNISEIYLKKKISENLIKKNKKFLIIFVNHTTCGLFAYYKHYLGCSLKALKNGYIPIIDLKSFPNVFNNFYNKRIKINPYEYYTLEEVLKNNNNYTTYDCNSHGYHYPKYDIVYNKFALYFWHVFSKKYMPIKIEIINEAIKIKKKLFNLSNNILGILVRGTDYLFLKPKEHPIQPELDLIYKDIKKYNKKYNYDFFFLTTEDNSIRTKFINEFGNKIKFYKKYQNFNFNISEKKKLCYFKGITGNFLFMKTYLINIIILIKCIDIITSMTSGTIGAFILSEGFRNKIVYNLGLYK